MQRINHQQFDAILRENENVLVVNVSVEEDAIPVGPVRWTHIPHQERGFVQRVARVLGSKDVPIVVISSNHDRPDTLDAGIKLDQSGFSHVFELTE